MQWSQRVSSMVRKHLANIQAAHDRRVDEAVARARRQLDSARTTQERKLVVLQFQRERAALGKELSEAKIATRRAKEAAEKARREAGDLTFGERLGTLGSGLAREARATYRGLSKATAPKRRRRKTVAKKTTPKAVKRR